MRWVYVDGACKKNGQPDAAAGYGVWFGNNHRLNVSEVVSGDLHSNNVAELQAAKAAIEIGIREGFNGLIIYTDSEYVYQGIIIIHLKDAHYILGVYIIKISYKNSIEGITNWIFNWKQNDWRTASGRPVANKSEWEDLEEAYNTFEEYHGEIIWRRIQAHNNNFGNEEADRLAKEAAERAFHNNQNDYYDDDEDDDDDYDYYY